MSATKCIYGVISGDNDRFRSMFNIYQECTKLGVVVPLEVLDFFDHEKPSSSGILVNLEHIAKQCSSDDEDGFQIDVKDIPTDIDFIRFVNRW